MLLSELPRDLPTFVARFGTDEQCRDHLIRARWPEGFRCAGCGHDRCHRCGHGWRWNARAAANSTPTWPERSSSRPRLASPAGFWRSGWSRRAKAGSRPWSCSGRWALAATRPPGAGCTRSVVSWWRPIVSRSPAGSKQTRRSRRRQARSCWPRCRRQGQGRGCGRERSRQGAWPAARAAAPGHGPRRLGAEPQRLSRPQPGQAGDGRHRRLVRLCRPATQGFDHEPIKLGRSWGDAALRLPAIHLVFSLAKRWLLGTHHGAVSPKHLQAYLDEYVFRLNRRTADSIAHRFARLVEHAVLTPPLPYRTIVHAPA